MKTKRYDEKVDKHIYGIEGGVKSPEGWIDVAIAALDQAGFSRHTQSVIFDELNEIGNQEGIIFE